MRLSSCPAPVRLRYLGGHPCLPDPGLVWAARAGSRLRLAEVRGRWTWELPLDRLGHLALLGDGQVRLRCEPTPGLTAVLRFRSSGRGALRLLELLECCN